MDYINQENKEQSEHDEISLVDYIKIILKRKVLILGFLLFGLIIGGGLTFLLPKTYKVETYLEIGNYSRRLVDFSSIIETPFNMIEKINSGFYGDYLGVEASNPPETSLVKIEIISKDPEDAKKNLEDINRSILDEHNQKITVKKEILENSIKELQKKINFLLSKNKEIETLELEVFYIQRQIDSFQSTEIIKEPAVVSKTEPNLAFNLIFGGLLGVFIGVFLAFGKEWWGKNKAKI